jgi:hypothetical protein
MQATVDLLVRYRKQPGTFGPLLPHSCDLVGELGPQRSQHHEEYGSLQQAPARRGKQLGPNGIGTL